MAVKIRLKRLGKIRVPQYRIVVVDSRKKRDGRVLEEIGKYHPKEEPSLIDVVSDALKEAAAEPKGAAVTTKKKAEKKTEEPAAEAPAEVPADETPEGAAEAAEAAETVTAEDAGKSEA